MGQKKILSLVVIIMVIIIIVGTVKLFDYQPTENLETSEVDSLIENDNVMMTTSLQEEKIVNDNLLRDLANPRLRIRNVSGVEVIGLDHNGTIAGIDLQIDNDATISGTGFFGTLGSLGSKISKLWTTDVEASGAVNFTGNITVSDCIIGGNGATICFVEV